MTPTQTLIYFIGILLATLTICAIVYGIVMLMHWVRSVIACWRDNASDDEVKE